MTRPDEIVRVVFEPVTLGMGIGKNNLSSCDEEDTTAIDQPLPLYPDVFGYQVFRISVGNLRDVHSSLWWTT